MPGVLLSTRGAHNCGELSWRAWNALHHLQHPTCVSEETPLGLSPVLRTAGKFCGVMLVTTQETVSYSTPKNPTRLCHLLCQVLPTHLLKGHFFSKKLQLEVLTLLQRWETEAQGFLQLRNNNQISHI